MKQYSKINTQFILPILFAVCTVHSNLDGQTNPNFNINLLFNYNAAEQSIALFNDQPVTTETLAGLRGNVISASTAQLIENSSSPSSVLQQYLDSLKYHQIIKNDIYHLEDARRNAEKIDELLTHLQKRNFSAKVVATVEQIFPADASVNITIPIYVVTLGHENVDAFVRRIVWHDDLPRFVGENEGELTIVINLAHAVNYGRTPDERIVSLLGVVAHEVFHAAFGAYKDGSSTWKSFYTHHQQPIDQLLDLTQNEGIAYYLSMEEQLHGNTPPDWFERTRDVFASFNNNASALLSDRLTPRQASELLRKANLSGYRDSYGSMTGLAIAREIDLQLGRPALIETIRKGPYDFFQKYITLTERDSNLPKLRNSLVEALKNGG